MLILDRKADQQIIIGNGAVKMKIIKIMDDGVIRIGFKASSNIAIDREEIFLQKLLKQEIDEVQL